MRRPGSAIAVVSLLGLSAMSAWIALAPPPAPTELHPFSGEVITLLESRDSRSGRQWDLTVHAFPPTLHHTEAMPGFDPTGARIRAGTWVTGLAEWRPGDTTATCWALRTDRTPLIDYEEMLTWYRDQRGFGVAWLCLTAAAAGVALAIWIMVRKRR